MNIEYESAFLCTYFPVLCERFGDCDLCVSNTNKAGFMNVVNKFIWFVIILREISWVLI